MPISAYVAFGVLAAFAAVTGSLAWYAFNLADAAEAEAEAQRLAQIRPKLSNR